MEKRKTAGQPPKEDRNEVKNIVFKLNSSQNQLNAHGTKTDVYKALHTAIEQPEEMKKLINKLESKK